MSDPEWNENNKRVLRAEDLISRGWQSLALWIGVNVLGAAPAVLLAIFGNLREQSKLFAIFVMIYILCAYFSHTQWERAKLGRAIRRGNYRITRDLLCEKEHYVKNPGSRSQTHYYNLFFRRGDTGGMERQSVRKSRSDSLTIGASYYRFAVNGKVLDIVPASMIRLDERLEAHRYLSKEEKAAKTANTKPMDEPAPVAPMQTAENPVMPAETQEPKTPAAPAAVQTQRPRPERPRQAPPRENPVKSREVQRQVDSLRMGPIPFRLPEGLSNQEKEERRGKMRRCMERYLRWQKWFFLLEPGMLPVLLLCFVLFPSTSYKSSVLLWFILPLIYLFSVGAALRRRAGEEHDYAFRLCPDQAALEELREKINPSEKWTGVLPLILMVLQLILIFVNLYYTR